MAEYLGYSNAQISRYLNDKGQPPRAQVLRLWAIRCGVPFEWLRDGVSDDPDSPEGLGISGSGCNGRILPFRARAGAEVAVAA